MYVLTKCNIGGESIPVEIFDNEDEARNAASSVAVEGDEWTEIHQLSRFDFRLWKPRYERVRSTPDFYNWKPQFVATSMLLEEGTTCVGIVTMVITALTPTAVSLPTCKILMHIQEPTKNAMVTEAALFYQYTINRLHEAGWQVVQE